MADGATQHAISPTVLRERARRLDDLASDVSLGTFPFGNWERGGEQMLNAAVDLRLLADLLDAIGPTEYLPYKVRDLREGRATSSTANWIERIDAVLEAHHD